MLTKVRILWILTATTILIHETVAEEPKECWGQNRREFGPNCEYQCYCKDGGEYCDRIDGSCLTGCGDGRFGPGCQYENAAFRRNVGSNIVKDVHHVTNGREEQCTSQDAPYKDPYVTVDIQNVQLTSEVFIIFRNYENATGFEVYIGKTPDRNVDTLCAVDPGISTENMVDVFCGRRMEAPYLTIALPGDSRELDICEVIVNNGRTLAYERPTFMSSIYSNNERNYGPGNAVNGHDRPETRTGVETPEEKRDPWWYVYFGGKRRITNIRIKNNNDHLDKMRDTHIFACNQTDCSDKMYIHRVTTYPVPEYVDVPLADVEARCVGLQLLGEDRNLIFFQVEVFGGCPENRCGIECRDFCFCEENVKTMWDEQTGNCPGECKTNWRKVDGKCSTSVCEAGRFGLGCRYHCNCEDTCDAWTGSCLSAQNDTLERCKLHWYGTSCQGYNTLAGSQFTAEGNTTYQSAEMTVDGNLKTCGSVLGGQGASWTAPLTTLKHVGQVAVYVNSSRTGFGLEIMAENENQAKLCRTTWNNLEGLYIAYCGNVLSTHVRVRTRSTMQICEVAVLECANGTFGDLCDNMCHCMGGATCDKETGECPEGGCENGYFGSSCDLECYPGFYGPGCTVRCGYCKNGEVCDRTTGWCENGCSAGWRGSRCDQECRDGTYGVDCVMDCGYCLDGEPCDKKKGSCPTGCDAGFQGINCTTVCPEGRYSYNCNETCGSCINGEPCSKTDGTCRGGCLLGKQPPYCQTDCDVFTYGLGCYGVCGRCNYNQTCNPVTGVCENGCVLGVYVDANPKCTQECMNGYFGYNCTQTCATDVCAETDVCNKTNGECLKGCKYPGYQAPRCVALCNDGNYGYDCNYTCGRCINQETCNKTNGICPNGCEQGFLGSTCHTSESTQGLSTTDAILLGCGIFLLLFAIAILLIVYIKLKRRRDKKDIKNEDCSNAKSDKTRNVSIISRVYENNINIDTDNANVANEKSRNNLENYQLSQMMPKGTIVIEDLWNYVLENKAAKAEMGTQFNELTFGLTHPYEAARRSNNLRKNRYKEIFPYDHTRVKLNASSEESGHDYINACFISGYNRPHMYIAAQGPTEELINDFWRMIWEQKCRKIVMLTKLIEQTKMRCAQYWPDEGEEQYGPVTISFKEAESFADFDIRTFIITVEGRESREVKQFHFTSWPDRQVPEYASSVVHFWSKVRTTDTKDNVPILVHCSAGIGRSGTYIALDYLVDQASIEGYINVFQCVQNLRHQRVNMVQTQEQYIFLHEALVEALLCPSTAVPCERFPHTCKKLFELEPKTRKPRLQCEFEKLQHITKFHDSLKTSFYDNNNYMTARKEENQAKNRSATILPSDVYRPWLNTRVHGRTDYINAVFLPSYREDRRYLITQSPLHGTIVDFWRMVYENKVTAIVSFDMESSLAEVYWPVEGETATIIPFQIHNVREMAYIDYVERTVKLLNAAESREKARVIKIFECKFWNGERNIPLDTSPILTVIDQVEQWQAASGSQQLVVHCLNGANKSGVFCVLAAAIEQLKADREVALAQILKEMRIRRHQIIPYYEQYKFCHDVILEFLKNFDTFSNFFI